jgi:hypothetical protein
MPSMVKGGFTSSPSQVYFVGISWLFSNVGLVTDNFFMSITPRIIKEKYAALANKKFA